MKKLWYKFYNAVLQFRFDMECKRIKYHEKQLFSPDFTLEERFHLYALRDTLIHQAFLEFNNKIKKF